MKILILNSHTPFIYGGAEILVDNLLRHLKNRGHHVDLIKIPDSWGKDYFLEGILQAKLIPLHDQLYKADLIITLKFPSYHVEHPHKVIWFLHHFRPLYERWDENWVSYEDKALRKEALKLDTQALASAQKIFAQSKTVAKRLEDYNQLFTDILYPPLDDRFLYSNSEPEDFILYPSRLSPQKRQILAIKALANLKSPLKLILTGQPENEVIHREILSLIEKFNLKERVIYLGEVSREELLKLYSKSLGVLFIPQDEDYGFVTLEAMASAKPVITCKDSGGPLEFVEHKNTGLISDPEVGALVEAMDYLYTKRKQSIEMGKRAFEKYKTLDISWERVITTLLSPVPL